MASHTLPICTGCRQPQHQLQRRRWSDIGLCTMQHFPMSNASPYTVPWHLCRWTTTASQRSPPKWCRAAASCSTSSIGCCCLIRDSGLLLTRCCRRQGQCYKHMRVALAPAGHSSPAGPSRRTSWGTAWMNGGSTPICCCALCAQWVWAQKARTMKLVAEAAMKMCVGEGFCRKLLSGHNQITVYCMPKGLRCSRIEYGSDVAGS